MTGKEYKMEEYTPFIRKFAINPIKITADRM